MLLTVKASYMFVAGGDSVSVLDSLSILLLLLILFVKSFNIKKKTNVRHSVLKYFFVR